MSQVLTRALLVVAVFVAVALQAVRRVEVTGASMTPALQQGQRLAVLPLRPVVGRLVVLRDPRRPSRVLVKRCTALLPDGRVEVWGDNRTASTDSRHFGPVDPELVLGRPVYRYEPAAATGWLWSA